MSAPHVAIVGSGPAGIAAAVCLQERGVACTVLEQGPTTAAGMRRIDPEMEILSPLRLSRMPGMRAAPDDPTYLRFPAYVAKLDELCTRRAIAVTTNARVERVERSGAAFRLTLAGGATLAATHVVNATGQVSHPQLPSEFDPRAAKYRWKHSLDFRSGDLDGCRRFVVIGGGQSSVEVLERWLERRRAGDRAWISLRSPLKPIPHRVLGVDVHYLVWPVEFLDARWLGLNPIRFRDPMIGFTTSRAIRRGAIDRLGVVRSYEPDALITADGQRVEPDLVVFATGFRYVLDHVAHLLDHDRRGWPKVRGCESVRTPGLYLLGLRYCRTVASAYLRGIARDARAIAARIAG